MMSFKTQNKHVEASEVAISPLAEGGQGGNRAFCQFFAVTDCQPTGTLETRGLQKALV